MSVQAGSDWMSESGYEYSVHCDVPGSAWTVAGKVPEHCYRDDTAELSLPDTGSWLVRLNTWRVVVWIKVAWVEGRLVADGPIPGALEFDAETMTLRIDLESGSSSEHIAYRECSRMGLYVSRDHELQLLPISAVHTVLNRPLCELLTTPIVLGEREGTWGTTGSSLRVFGLDMQPHALERGLVTAFD